MRAGLGLAVALSTLAPALTDQLPNIVVVVADDVRPPALIASGCVVATAVGGSIADGRRACQLGWNDVGWHNTQMKTPVLDALAAGTAR